MYDAYTSYSKSLHSILALLPPSLTVDMNTPSLYCAVGSPDANLSDQDIKSHLLPFLDSLGARTDVLILPPDYTRLPSQAGKITRFVAEHYNFVDGEDVGTAASNTPATSPSKPNIAILPALGTHAPMTDAQIRSMFGQKLANKAPSPFVVHNWRKDVVTIGHAPADMVSAATNGMVKEEWPAQLNRLVWDKRHSLRDPAKQQHKSLVLSVGQVVPHEVMGMANFNKNLFVGVGGVEAINLSHFIGAVHGMEKMMGRSSNPLRSILNYASEQFLQKEIDLWYILTVMGANVETGALEVRGLYIGNDIECYNSACELSLQVNFTLLDRPLRKVVVYLDGDKYQSTWLGCKAIYRTRMAIADGGELIILGPGLKEFGEDKEIDKLIRRYGYIGTPAVLQAMNDNEELKESLSAVAHLIHGSTEGRFSVTFAPGHLTKEEIEGVGFQFEDIDAMKNRYDPTSLKDGWNTVHLGNGDSREVEEIFYISNPALGLWSLRSRFEESNEIPSDNIGAEAIALGAHQEAVGGSGGIGGWEKPPMNPEGKS